MEYKNRIYEIFYPNSSLVGSQLDSQQFAKHYTAGSTRYYKGKVVFAEIDYGFRHSYFDIESALSAVKSHEDGRPKATKFIASYRILEHIDFNALRNLHLTSPDGNCIELHEAPYERGDREEPYKIYVEIDPLRMLVLSTYDFVEFGSFITDPKNPIGAPKFLYTQLDLNIHEFLEEFEENPFMSTPIPALHPSLLRDAVKELGKASYKNNKGLSLDAHFESIPYKLIKNGFMFASQEDMRYYPMPAPAEIERMNFKFWRSM
jgi:hypothetical protein